MSYTLRLFGIAFASAGRRYLVPIILAALTMSLAVGGGAAYSGGSFWQAAKFGLLAAVAAGVLYVLIASALAIKNGFK